MLNSRSIKTEDGITSLQHIVQNNDYKTEKNNVIKNDAIISVADTMNPPFSASGILMQPIWVALILGSNLEGQGTVIDSPVYSPMEHLKKVLVNYSNLSNSHFPFVDELRGYTIIENRNHQEDSRLLFKYSVLETSMQDDQTFPKLGRLEVYNSPEKPEPLIYYEVKINAIHNMVEKSMFDKKHQGVAIVNDRRKHKGVEVSVVYPITNQEPYSAKNPDYKFLKSMYYENMQNAKNFERYTKTRVAFYIVAFLVTTLMLLLVYRNYKKA